MFFSLDVMRARKGDCLMLHYGTENDLRIILIDGGPGGVYEDHLKPRIEQIKSARELSESESLNLEMLMVSHVDDDHIHGILELTKELTDAHKANENRRVEIAFFWHNSFDDVLGKTPKEVKEDLSQSAQASLGGSSIEFDEDDLDEELLPSLKVLASIQQGQQLRSYVVNGLGARLNFEFGGQVIVAQENGKKHDVGNGLTFTVIGPMLPEVEKLKDAHQKWLQALADQGKTPEDVLSAYSDKSVPNLSSIVVLAEFDEKTILLTGDARGDKILQGLELVKLVEPGGKLSVNILKAPHHGSSNNLDNDFFERIHAEHYVFSGNGEHGNPERETLEMLLKARGNEPYEVHLTYPIDEIDEAREAEWKKQQAREKKRREKAILENKTPREVREDWSPENHSLGALFDANPDFAAKLRIITGDEEPHVINLLDTIDPDSDN